MALAQNKKYSPEYGHPSSNPIRKFHQNSLEIASDKDSNTITYNKSIDILELAVPTQKSFKQTKDMNEWTVQEVHEWILSIEDGKLSFVAKQLQKKQVNGLKFIGIKHKYLNKLGIKKQDIQLLIKSRDQILNPPSLIKKTSAIPISFTPLMDTTRQFSNVHLPMILNSLEAAMSSPLAQPDEIVESADELDEDQLIAELVRVSTDGLSENWTKSNSVYDQQAALSPTSYYQPPEQEAADKKPPSKRQLTVAQTPRTNEPKLRIEVDSQFSFNAEADEFYPNTHSTPNLPQIYCASPKLLSPALNRLRSAPLETIKESHMKQIEYESKSHVQKCNNVKRKKETKKYKRKVFISQRFTKFIPNVIRELIPEKNLFDFIHLSIRLQHAAEYNHGNVRIFDFDLHDKDGQKLYCMVEKTKNRRKGALAWTMKERLYTKEEIQDMNEFYEIPTSIRGTFDDTKTEQNDLSDKLEADKIISSTNWCKVPMHCEFNGKLENVRRWTLSLTKEAFIERLTENEDFMNMKDIDLIPIIAFHDDHNFHIEYVQIVNIDSDRDVDIGISYTKDKKYGVCVSGIYTNKEELRNLHYLVRPRHIGNCKCFDKFTTTINHLAIGNPNDAQNQINDLRKQVKFFQHRSKEFLQEIDELQKQIKQLNFTMMMNTKQNGIAYSRSTPQTQLISPTSNTYSSDSLFYDANHKFMSVSPTHYPSAN